jgi:hypothetical protein
MIRHIFTLMLNQKRMYGGMLLEQVFVFIVLLFCFTTVGKNMSQYYSPGMLDTDNTLKLALFPLSPTEPWSTEEVERKMDRIVADIRNASCVEAIGKSLCLTPYSRPEEMNPWDSIRIEGKRMKVFIKKVDGHMQKVFSPRMEEGEWLTDDMRLEDGSFPVVVTRQLVDEVGWTIGMGRKIYFRGMKFTVVGIVAGIKQEVLLPSPPVLIMPMHVPYQNWYSSEYAVRVKEGEEDTFRDLIQKEVDKMMGKDNVMLWIGDVAKWKVNDMQDTFITLLAIGVPTIFLLVFAFIGTFGLFWLYSSKRRKEFALRLVVGSTCVRLFQFVIFESVLLTLLALVPGCILFCWVYSFSTVNLTALGAAVGAMMLFSVFSAWYPAYQVSRVNPVEAMREE